MFRIKCVEGAAVHFFAEKIREVEAVGLVIRFEMRRYRGIYLDVSGIADRHLGRDLYHRLLVFAHPLKDIHGQVCLYFVEVGLVPIADLLLSTEKSDIAPLTVLADKFGAL